VSETNNCKHSTLRMGSGGYYIFCADCNSAWIAWKMGEDERVSGVMKGQSQCGCSAIGMRAEVAEKSCYQHGMMRVPADERFCPKCGKFFLGESGNQ